MKRIVVQVPRDRQKVVGKNNRGLQGSRCEKRCNKSTQGKTDDFMSCTAEGGPAS